MALKTEGVRGWVSRLLDPGAGCCRFCATVWAWAPPHILTYKWGRSCFALCEACHRKLPPAERLIFYRRLWRGWINSAAPHEWWERWESWLYIEDAVAQERHPNET